MRSFPVLLLLAVSFAVGNSAAQQLQCKPCWHVFPKTQVGASSSYSFELVNVGKSVLRITSVSSPGNEFSLGSVTLPASLQPGQTMSLPVTFAPTAVGYKVVNFTISSNDPRSPRKAKVAGAGIYAAIAATGSQTAGGGSSTAGVSSDGYYGSGLQFDALDNFPIQYADVDYRFRAVESGAVNSFIWWNQNGITDSGQDLCPHYGCGNGGTIQICIYPDDGTANHFYTGAPLACVTHYGDLRTTNHIRTDTFSVPPILTAGTLYHLHWTNLDADPVANFISVNNTVVFTPTVPMQPTVSDVDLAVLTGGNGSYPAEQSKQDTPIYQLNYANGTVQGQGYVESWIELPVDISGINEVSEAFTVSGSNRTVSQVSVRLSEISGNEPLTVTLAALSGTTIEQGTIASFQQVVWPSSMNTSGTWPAYQPVWGNYTFTSPHILAAGQTYRLTLSTSSNALYQAYAIHRGTIYGLTSPSFFGDGQGAQLSTNDGSGWSCFTQPGGSVNNCDADLQFFFVTQ